jgi:hypothetical protein
MKRLAEIMPKSAAANATSVPLSLKIELHPICQAAESFASYINDELPANSDELRAILWVFGEILNGEMERRLNYAIHAQNDLLNTLPLATNVVKLTEEKTDGTQPKPAI